jgi:hypothetical protein
MRHLPDLIKIYRHMKSEEDRYGMAVKIADLMKVSKV